MRKTKIINPYRPIRETIPRPTSKQLVEIVRKLYGFSCDHTHDLNRYSTERIDHFFAASISVVSSNLMAMVKLQPPFLFESQNVLRNIVETCMDFFWVASIYIDDPKRGEQLATNFFLFAEYKYIEMAEVIQSLDKKDHFVGDFRKTFINEKMLEECKQKVNGIKFGKSWRHQYSSFNRKDIGWQSRADIAAEFVQKYLNLKKAPYLKNLEFLSSYAHFDPAQIQTIEPRLRRRIFDRNLNIGIGFLYDMLIYSLKRKNWNPAGPFLGLKEKFLWFST